MFLLKHPWLLVPAKWAHGLSHWALPFFTWLYQADTADVFDSFSWRGLHFKNRLGTAGGLDKSGQDSFYWSQLGPGFLEIGTVTPLAQAPNPGEIIRRDLSTRSVWNKMGFPSEGAASTLLTLEELRNVTELPLFINIGKNRHTTQEQAASDYQKCAQILDAVADTFVINISSPNTQGLRNLQSVEELKKIVSAVRTQTRKPLLLKLSPDWIEPDFKDLIQSCALELDIQGFVLTNTTTQRTSTPFYPVEGGASGLPVKEASMRCLQWAIEALANRRNQYLLISTGGVFDESDVLQRRKMGADLIQIYTALVYQGPGLYRQILGRLQAKQNDGLKQL